MYAIDNDAEVVGKAQAMVALHQKKTEPLSPISEGPEEKAKLDQKGKSIENLKVDASVMACLSPKQKISDASVVHCSESPLMTY